MRPVRVSRSLRRRLIALGTPIMIQSALVMAVHQADRLMTGQLGDEAVAGVGLAGQLLVAGGLLFGVFATGCGILVAQYFGARRYEELRATVGTALGLGVLFGAAVAVPGVLGAAALLRGLGVSPEVARIGGHYMSIEACAFPAALVAAVATSSLASMGNTRAALWCAVVTMAAKLLVNAGLIFGLGPLPELGVTGAAIGGAVSHVVNGAMALGFLLSPRLARAEGRPVLTLGDVVRPRWGPMSRLLPLALPMVADMLTWQAAGIAYSALVATEGTLALAAWQVLLTVRNLGYLPVSGLPQAAETTVGQSLGRGRFQRARAWAAETLLLSQGAALAAIVLLVAVAPWMVGFYQVDSQARQMATVALFVLAALQPFENLNAILPAVLRVGGEPRAVLLISTASLLVVGVGGGYVAGRVLGFGLPGVLAAIFAEGAVKSTALFLRYRSGQWVKRLV